MCALEAVRILKENNIQLSHSVEVLATLKKKALIFGTVLLGSRFISGEFSEQDKDRLYNDRGNKPTRSAHRLFRSSGCSTRFPRSGVDQSFFRAAR
ncbi:hypothetical protein [Budvicia aquatica]|uniref:hypothetical protein n=1 Tax=Budvicia aquatica TaxID=82979 RepID=UPI0034CE57B3